MNLNNFFNPKTIAVIGASADKNKVGYALMSNLCAGSKRTILPISLSESEILGCKTYKAIKEIPGEISVDLAIIAVRSDIVPEIVNECGERGIKNVIVISAGFREIGESGIILENKVREIADKHGIALLGPNCLGTIDLNAEYNGSFGAKNPGKGNIAFLSQSGALGTSLLDMAIKEGVGFSKFISLGNEAQLSEIEFLEYLAGDNDTKAVLIYLEKLSNGKRFMELLSEITKTKPVVILKAGRSQRGMRAVMSHTGSLAPEDSIFSAAIRQSGAIAVESIREFFNLAKLFQLGITKPLKNIAIVTNGGGPSVVTADLVDLSRTLQMVELGDGVKESLRKVLPPMAAVGNPIDIIGDALATRYEEALKIVTSESGIDAIILMLTPQMMTEVESTAKLVVQYRQKKPIIPVFLGGPTVQAGLDCLKENGLVNFHFPKDAVEALDSLAHGETKKQATLPAHSSIIKQAEKERMMGYEEMSKLLSEYGIAPAGILLKEKSGLPEAIARLGNGPFAMKVISEDIVHKTDAGAVSLHINNLGEAGDAWHAMDERIKSALPQARIEGVLIQKMSSGREIIIGMKRDAVFGPTILFGLGGIFAEAIKDTSLRVAPIGKDEALKMMQEIKGATILNGMRGEKPVHFDSLANILTGLSRLSIEHPEIKEIDLNPVIATADEVLVVDARVMV
jgi:acetyltransferase